MISTVPTPSALNRILARRTRRGIAFTVSPADRQRLTGLINDRNAPQKHYVGWDPLAVQAKVTNRVAQVVSLATCVMAAGRILSETKTLVSTVLSGRPSEAAFAQVREGKPVFNFENRYRAAAVQG